MIQATGVTPLETAFGGADCCPLCAGNEARLRFREGRVRVQDCLQCGVTYVTPRRSGAELLREVYGADYWRSPCPRTRGYADYAGDAELYGRTFARRWRSLARHVPASGRALDVGCAAGFFLAFLAERGFQVQGLEPSVEIAALARERVGAQRVQVATLEQAELEPGSFDLISLWDVIEHLPQPLAALQRVRELLAPGGRVILETQDISSPMARLCGRRWQHFKHDEHLVHFTPASLTAACARAGLRVAHMQRRGAGKYVRGSFLAERSGRVHRALPGLLRPLLGGDWSIYVNPGDELIAILEAAP